MMMRKKSGQRGIGAVEFALILPIFCLLVFGIFEFGMAFWRKQSLTAAVREGARKMIVATSPRKSWGTVKPIVEDYMDGVGLTDGARTIVATPNQCAGSGTDMVITATYPTNFIFLSKFAGLAASKTITSSITMQCE